MSSSELTSSSASAFSVDVHARLVESLRFRRMFPWLRQGSFSAFLYFQAAHGPTLVLIREGDWSTGAVRGHPEESQPHDPTTIGGDLMKLYVGIDVSSTDLYTCIMDQEGNTCAQFKVDNHLLGATFLRDQILLWANKRQLSEILIGMEATSVYSWHPTMFFHQQEALKS